MKFSEGMRVDRAVRFVWQAAPGWMAASAGILVVQSALPLATLYVFKLIIDYVTGLGADPVARGGAVGDILGLVGVGLGISLTANLLHALIGHVSTVQAQLVADHMQRIVQGKSIAMDVAYYENSQFFDKLHRAQREAPTRPVRIIDGLTQVVRNGLTLLGSFALLAIFHWAIVAVVFAASIPVVVYRIKYAADRYALEREKTTTDRISKYLNQIMTTTDAAKELRVFGFGPLLMREFANLRATIRTSLRRLSAQGQRQRFITESAATLAGFTALAIIAASAATGATTVGQLVMYFGAFQVALSSLRLTLSGVGELYENNLFLSSLLEFLEVPRTVLGPAVPRTVPSPWLSGVRIDGLTFHYPGTNALVLDGVTLAIRPGEVVALVGRNGSGKTSLTKLLCRLYDPDDGRITIDGIDLREFDPDDLRRHISVIYQDYGRYHLTAAENIRLGCPHLELDDPAIIAAAKWAGIHDEIMTLDKGYDTVMGRALGDGEEFSIGQWQKLALARAYVRRSELIILDEPTSSLDAEAELAFFEHFRSMVQGRAALIISHRFSTVRMADRVYVLDGGRIIDGGTHEELVARGGLYADLYRTQASYYEPEPVHGSETA